MKNFNDMIGSHRNWYRQHQAAYELLTQEVCRIIQKLLENDHIEFLSVDGRTKTEDSFLEKIQRKKYSEPVMHVHDISGIRVITFVQSDAEKALSIIERSFIIHTDKSPDKIAELGADKIGYRSQHRVCELGDDRTKLPECSAFRGLLFEVQVRTVLQHAWAEIEHDRGYKFGGVLPTHLARRLNLASGLLEIADREFDTLALEIEKYSHAVSKETRGGRYEIDINSPSLKEFYKELSGKKGFDSAINWINEYVEGTNKVIEELHSYGVRTLADLDDLISRVMSENVHPQTDNNQVGFTRDIMILDDIDKYFNEAWNQNWTGIAEESVEIFGDKYGKKKIDNIINKFDLDIL